MQVTTPLNCSFHGTVTLISEKISFEGMLKTKALLFACAIAILFTVLAFFVVY